MVMQLGTSSLPILEMQPHSKDIKRSFLTVATILAGPWVVIRRISSPPNLGYNYIHPIHNSTQNYLEVLAMETFKHDRVGPFSKYEAPGI